MDIILMSPAELGADLGEKVRVERLRQNMTQDTLADRAGISRWSVMRMEADGTASLQNFLAVLSALHRVDDLAGVLLAPRVSSIEEFARGAASTRQRGRQ